MSVMIDTQVMFNAGMNLANPDLQKLFLHSKEGRIRLFVPHIVWEERRTQMVEDVCEKLRALDKAFKEVTRKFQSNLVLNGLPLPALNCIAENDTNTLSKEALTKFAADHRLEIVPLGADHAERAWQRFFDISLPFNPEQKRVDRRKDIPDSWILETALDLRERHPDLVALCADVKLTTALADSGIRVVGVVKELVDEIDSKLEQVDLPQAPIASPVEQVLAQQEEPEDIPQTSQLERILEDARNAFKNLELKAVGFVGALKNPTKDQLFGLLERSGEKPGEIQNVVEKLVLTELITDTGNHYIPRNQEACQLAAKTVEAELIRLTLGE